jgi:tryptophan synthase alpha subunit
VKYARGGIIGSAFIDILDKDGNMIDNINSFINEIIN